MDALYQLPLLTADEIAVLVAGPRFLWPCPGPWHAAPGHFSWWVGRHPERRPAPMLDQVGSIGPIGPPGNGL
jgi:hypothetical protein